MTPQQIRDAELPRARRGFEEGATRVFLANVSVQLAAVMRERDDLQKEVEELRERAAQHPTDAETIGAVLMTAHRAGEELLSRAAEEAAEIGAGAQTERDELLARAQSHAEALVAEAAAAVESLRHEDSELRRSIAVYRRELAKFLRSSLAQLEEVDSFGPVPAPALPDPPVGLDGELLARLPSE